MKSMLWKILVLAVALACTMAIMVNVSIAETANKVTHDPELAQRYADFEEFAELKLRQLNDNHKFSRSRMKVVKLDDGTYHAKFHEIDDESVEFKIRRSSSNKAPYVAIMSYREEVYESHGSHPADFDDEGFDVQKIIPNRHIFSYQKGVWK